MPTQAVGQTQNPVGMSISEATDPELGRNVDLLRMMTLWSCDSVN